MATDTTKETKEAPTTDGEMWEEARALMEKALLKKLDQVFRDARQVSPVANVRAEPQ